MSAGEIPQPRVERPGRSRWPSPVWLVPLLAVLAALGLLVQTLATRGPLITVEFASASGLSAGETVVRYRDVDVGQVETVRFSEDLTHVVAEIRMDGTVAPYLDASARFWVVRPQVTAQGISGLETVISGSYIEASWDTEPGTPVARFVAEENPPLTPEGTPGIRVRLRAIDGGSLEIGSPIFFKRVEVGRIESKTLTADGEAVEFGAFISAPNDRRVTTASRFWNASGVDLQLGADGARLRIASLSSLIRGGASFSSPEGGAPVEPGHVFPLLGSEGEAEDTAMTGDLADQVAFDILFQGSVRGLRDGAPVEYRGIRVGRVNAVEAAVDPETGEFRTRTSISLSPSLLGLEEGDRAAVLDFLRGAVRKGLRAKLAMGNLLTGALYINLQDTEAADQAGIDEAAEVPVLPSIASDLDELTGSVEGLLDRVDALPVEALLANAVTLLDNLNRLAANESTRAIPDSVLDVLTAAEGLAAAPELRRTAAEAEALVTALRKLADDPALKAAPGHLDALLTSLGGLSAEIERAGTVADLAASVAALRKVLEDPAFARLPAEAGRTLSATTALLENPALTTLPEAVAETLATLRTTLTLPGIAELPGDLRGTVASLRARLDSPGLAQALADLGPLVTSLRQTAEGANAHLDPLLTSARALLDAPGTRAVPDELRATLTAARELLEEAEIDAVTGEAVRTLAALRQILEALETRNAPQELTATLTAARGLLASLVEARAAENLSETLRATRRLAQDPALTRAAGELAETLAALRAVLAAPGAEALPAALEASLTSAAALIEQFQKENLGGAVAGALDGVETATRSAEGAFARVPALVAQLTRLAESTDRLLASVSVGSELNYEAVATIREIRDAARALTDLADLVQQKPNAILLGK